MCCWFVVEDLVRYRIDRDVYRCGCRRRRLQPKVNLCFFDCQSVCDLSVGLSNIKAHIIYYSEYIRGQCDFFLYILYWHDSHVCVVVGLRETRKVATSALRRRRTQLRDNSVDDDRLRVAQSKVKNSRNKQVSSQRRQPILTLVEWYGWYGGYCVAQGVWML